jgi:hypothetical protein
MAHVEQQGPVDVKRLVHSGSTRPDPRAGSGLRRAHSPSARARRFAVALPDRCATRCTESRRRLPATRTRRPRTGEPVPAAGQADRRRPPPTAAGHRRPPRTGGIARYCRPPRTDADHRGGADRPASLRRSPPRVRTETNAGRNERAGQTNAQAKRTRWQTSVGRNEPAGEASAGRNERRAKRAWDETSARGGAAPARGRTGPTARCGSARPRPGRRGMAIAARHRVPARCGFRALREAAGREDDAAWPAPPGG